MSVLTAIRDLLSEVEEGRYALPEVQRPYVWGNKKVKELFESIYKGYPIGSIIVWNMPEKIIENYSELLRPLTQDLDNQRNNFQYMVIDGQQRLVSLLLAERGTINVYVEQKVQRRALPLFFSIKERGSLELARGKEKDRDSHCFKVSDLLNKEKDIDELLDEKDVASNERKLIRKKLNNFRDAVLNYPVNIYQIPESTLKYNDEEDNFLEIFEKISEMFINLNMTGIRVKMPQLILALLTARTRREYEGSFREKVGNLSSKLENLGWDISEGVLMRSYMAIATGETNFRKAREMLGKLEASKVLEFLKQTDEALCHTCQEIFGKQLNIKSERYLKSQYSLVTLTHYMHKKNLHVALSEISKIKRWLILASFSGRYTGRLESDLKEDIDALSKGLGFEELEKRLTVRSLGQSHLDASYDNEHLTALLILLGNSYDLSNDYTKISELSNEKLEVHHIFPRNLLAKVYGEKIGDMDVETAYDHVANITIISKDANNRIKDKRPDNYLKDIDEEVIKTHYIPVEPFLWKPENFLDFLKRRMEILLNELNQLLAPL
jgi:hypothetical protein